MTHDVEKEEKDRNYGKAKKTNKSRHCEAKRRGISDEEEKEKVVEGHFGSVGGMESEFYDVNCDIDETRVGCWLPLSKRASRCSILRFGALEIPNSES